MKYCIKYVIVDYPMGASPPYPYPQAGYNLTKEEADEWVEKLNHEDYLRVEKIISEGKGTSIFYDYFATEAK